jgi:hypothetical protein
LRNGDGAGKACVAVKNMARETQRLGAIASTLRKDDEKNWMLKVACKGYYEYDNEIMRLERSTQWGDEWPYILSENRPSIDDEAIILDGYVESIDRFRDCESQGDIMDFLTYPDLKAPAPFANCPSSA